MRRAIGVCVAVMLSGCNSDERALGTDSVERCVDEGVPDEFCFLWDVSEWCEPDGFRTFRVVDQAAFEGDSFIGTEKWYRYYPPDRSLDSVDVVQLVGERAAVDANGAGCQTCEHVFDVTLFGLEVASGWSYDGKQERLILDTRTAAGGPNPDDRLMLHRVELTENGSRPIQLAYFEGKLSREGDQDFPSVGVWSTKESTGDCSAEW